MNSRTSRTKTRDVLACAAMAALVGLVVIACGDDDDEIDPTGSCGEIARVCHPYDKISTIGHDCHELGHAGDDKACGPRREECVAACPPMEGGASGGIDAAAQPDANDRDAALPEAGPDAAPDPACVTYCDCLTETCSMQTGYPFASKDACLAKCATLGAERACWSNFCQEAKGLEDKVHACEHAWGQFGVDECD